MRVADALDRPKTGVVWRGGSRPGPQRGRSAAEERGVSTRLLGGLGEAARGIGRCPTRVRTEGCRDGSGRSGVIGVEHHRILL